MYAKINDVNNNNNISILSRNASTFHRFSLNSFLCSNTITLINTHSRCRYRPIAASAFTPVDTVNPNKSHSSSDAINVIEKSINTIRFLAIDAVEKANSGHPGLPMGCAPIGHILYDEVMKYNPKNPFWFNRDRFVLSAGHGCMLHYALLHLSGYDSVKVGTMLKRLVISPTYFSDSH